MPSAPISEMFCVSVDCWDASWFSTVLRVSSEV